MAIYINSFALSQGTFSIVLSSAVTAYNLASDLTNNHGWDGVEAIEVKLTINSGVLVKSNTTATPAITVNLVSGSTLTLTNNGTIRGHYGTGGTAASGAIGGSGSGGGAAISLQNISASIINAGEISGGGGVGGNRNNR